MGGVGKSENRIESRHSSRASILKPVGWGCMVSYHHHLHVSLRAPSFPLLFDPIGIHAALTNLLTWPLLARGCSGSLGVAVLECVIQNTILLSRSRSDNRRVGGYHCRGRGRSSGSGSSSGRGTRRSGLVLPEGFEVRSLGVRHKLTIYLGPITNIIGQESS